MFNRTDINPLNKTKQTIDGHIFGLFLAIVCIPIFYFGWILDFIAFLKDSDVYKQKSTWSLSWTIAIIIGLISLKLFKPIDKFLDKKINLDRIELLSEKYSHSNIFFNTFYQIFFVLFEPFILLLLVILIIISAKYFVWIPNNWVEEDWLFRVKLNL